MKRPPSFEGVAGSMLDAWIASAEGLDDPKTIYAASVEALRLSMMLVTACTRSTNPKDLCFEFIQRYRLPSRFRDVADLVPGAASTLLEAGERQRPVFGRVTRTVGDVQATFDQVVLPQKNKSGRSAWCVGLFDVKLLLPVAVDVPRLDDVDLAIIQLLAEGATAKEIAAACAMSSRTIQHRIESLKSRFAARSIGHLVAFAISTAIIPDPGR